MYTVENSIRDFLKLKGIELFWIDAHVNVIRQGLATNRYFATHVIEQSITKRMGRLNSYRAVIGVRSETGSTSNVVLTYRFNPKVKKAHKLWVNNTP